MFHQFKITFYAIILCLFGLTLMNVSTVFAEDSPEFIACQEMKGKRNIIAKKNCFRDLAESLQAELEATAAGSPQGTLPTSCTSEVIAATVAQGVKDNKICEDYANPLNDRIAQLEGELAELQQRLAAALATAATAAMLTAQDV